MVTIIPINEEEKMSIITGLRSSVPATKLITLKKIADIADMRSESLQYMEMIDKTSMNEIISSIERIVEINQDEILKREAMITLEKIKKALGTKFTENMIYCKNCEAVVDVGWEHCANCGADLNKMEFEDIEPCPNCKKHTSESWVHCAHCGVSLKEENKILRCPNCKRPIDSTWMVCPYCGYRLKRVK